VTWQPGAAQIGRPSSGCPGGNVSVWVRRSHPASVADLITGDLAAGPDGVRETVKAFGDIGATDIILNPTVGDQDEIARLADIVL
jgi:hypothetical protein